MPFLDSIKIDEFIDSLNVQIPSKEKFLQLTRIFPIYPQLKSDPIINYERGILLYSLIAKYKPKNVLEFGTAEGYSALCMAWAMTDYDINGRIFTIDPKPFDVPIKREITWEENPKHDTVLLSTKELWNEFANKEWIKKIEVLTGFSGEILQKKIKEFPKMDMGFIDGHHTYEAVIHDFYAFLQTTSENFYLLFDDYIINGIRGVTKVIDEEVVPNFDVTLIKTNAKQQRKEVNESKNELDMCWMKSSSLKKPLQEIYPKSKSEQIISKYLKWEKRWKLRKNLNSKIPLLSRFRFRH
jgi:predicted O-methyltransferase YrrM